MTTFINRQTLIDADWLNNIDSRVNNVRTINPLIIPFNAPINGTTDALAALQAAINTADDNYKYVIDCQGVTFALSGTLKITKKNVKLINFKLVPLAGYVSGTVVYTDMGSNQSTVTGTQLSNRGNPLLRVSFRDTVHTIADFDHVVVDNFEIDGQDIAPGMLVEGASQGLINHFSITRCKGYGLALLVRNTETVVQNGKVFEAAFGSAKQTNPGTTPYTSAGIVIQCPDVVLSNVTANYAQYPWWLDRFSNIQMSSCHAYNGNGAGLSLPNMYVGPNCSGIASVNFYNDKGYIEFNSFDHVFLGGRWVGPGAETSNDVYAKIISQGPSQVIEGLIIDNISTSVTGSHGTVSIDETAGNITNVRNCKISPMACLTDGGTRTNGFAHNKNLVVTIASGDWVNEGSVFRYDWDLNSDILFTNAYTTVRPLLLDRRTATNQTPLTWGWRFLPNSGPGTKTLSFYSAQAVNATGTVVINEGNESALLT